MLPVELAPTATDGPAEVGHAGAVVLAEVARAGRPHVLAHVAGVAAELGEVGEGLAAVDDEPLDGTVQAHHTAPRIRAQAVQVPVM